MKYGFFGLICAIFLTAGCTVKEPQFTGPTVLMPDKTAINVELAISQDEQSLGLMYRDHMDQNHGMVFPYNKPQSLNFWMKNTLIPLDIIFLDENRKVVNIAKAMPCKEDELPCEIYRSTAPAMYVLEVNQGVAEKHKLKIGDELEFVHMKFTE